jgi:N-acetylmuramoyl-L-alanine amidase
LPVRADIARRRTADLFISLHFNSAPSPSIQGAQVYCMTPQRASSSNAGGEGATSQTYPGNINNSKNMLLAYELQKSIVRGAGAEDQSVRRARFQVLREVNMPAALIEAGYMSSPSESKRIFSEPWRRQLAQSIATGIESYRKTVER